MIELLTGPLIGAVIGYCTNYVAVKMLFRPLNPIKIGNYVLPFTPGVIPKRKEELAKVVGAAVEKSLFGKEDLKGVLLTDEMKQTVSEMIADAAAAGMENTIRELAEGFAGEEVYTEKKEQIAEILTVKITKSLLKMDVGGIIAQEGAAAVKKRVEGTMLAMFLRSDMIAQLADMIGEKVTDYIQEDGQEKISGLVQQELEGLENKKIEELASGMGITRDGIYRVSGQLYEKAVESKADVIVEKFHIAEIIEQKIREMSAAELEKLVLSVMKKELGMVVNLGALIGFLLGFLNIVL